MVYLRLCLISPFHPDHPIGPGIAVQHEQMIYQGPVVPGAHLKKREKEGQNKHHRI